MPFCPRCREEYREGFTVCADCGVTLVDTQGPETPAEEGDRLAQWEQVAETAQIYEAELMALRLRESGLEAELVDQTFHQEPLTNLRDFAVVRVLVPAGKAEEARRLLAQSVALPEDAETGTAGDTADKEPEES
jgi:hypothetical protein